MAPAIIESMRQSHCWFKCAMWLCDIIINELPLHACKSVPTVKHAITEEYYIKLVILLGLLCITTICGLCSQHTAQAVPAAADPASCLSALHRRGGCELQQSHRQPGLQPAPQTHTSLLQGDGVRPVRPATCPALRRSDQLFYFKTDWAISAVKQKRVSNPGVQLFMHSWPPSHHPWPHQSRTDLSG